MKNYLQEELNKWIRDLPCQFASEMIDEKLRIHKIKLSKRRLNELALRLLAGEDHIQFDPGKAYKNANIEFTDKDFEALQERVDILLKEIPSIIESTARNSSLEILRILKTDWRNERWAQRRDIDGFCKRLNRQWGVGLDRLKMLLVIARELGSNIGKQGCLAGDNPRTFDVLTRLHARSCQVTEEVISLLENGFADGAMARWRTLHEIAVVSCLIGQYGDELADRYVAHQIVEARAAAIQYREHQQTLQLERLSDDEFEQIEKEYQAALQNYGESFGTQYGWSAKHLAKKRPNMADIQQAANMGHMSPYYRMASHNIHANPKGVFFKLGLSGEPGFLLAGRSNVGLADPGHAAALSLTQISSVLMKQNEIMDNIVAIKIMELLADEIGNAFLKAHRKLMTE